MDVYGDPVPENSVPGQMAILESVIAELKSKVEGFRVSLSSVLIPDKTSDELVQIEEANNPNSSSLVNELTRLCGKLATLTMELEGIDRRLQL
jgi:hypothetical protein